jgi:hypothetical protein
MKKLFWKSVLLAAILTATIKSEAQPVPVEFMAGNQYATVNVVLSKNFTPTSRIGFFHLNTLTMNYTDKTKDDLALQNLLFFELTESFRVTGGAFYGTKPGFSPTAGMQYINVGKKWFILVSPRINIESEPTFNNFLIIRYKAALTDKTMLYLSLQALNLFEANGHIKSYQWFRTGLERKGTQFGVAFNADEFGSKPKFSYNFGLFVRREIF